MKPNPDLTNVNRASAAAVGAIVATLVFIVLAGIVKVSVTVPAIDADRDAAIGKALAEIHQTETEQLNTAGWVDKPRGIVRLPIDTAMKIAEQEWQNPAQAREDLKAREGKATAPAPKQPAKPNPFE